MRDIDKICNTSGESKFSTLMGLLCSNIPSTPDLHLLVNHGVRDRTFCGRKFLPL
jgi:hypothetical protein